MSSGSESIWLTSQKENQSQKHNKAKQQEFYSLNGNQNQSSSKSRKIVKENSWITTSKKPTKIFQSEKMATTKTKSISNNKSANLMSSVSNSPMKFGVSRSSSPGNKNKSRNVNYKIKNSSASLCEFLLNRIMLFGIGVLLLVDLSEGQSFFSPPQGTLQVQGGPVPVGASEETSLSTLTSSSSNWGGDSPFRSGTTGNYGSGFTCFNIPVNFTLCRDIGYSKMMIPNLLGHDSLSEAEYHAKSWNLLVGVQCHPDTQLFLCSLFSPICLDRPIYPCRSLCKGVQEKCEPRMLTYNYPWPDMLNCDKFPEDHDLCIKPGAANNSEKIDDPDCPSCNQAHTCENIVDHFCRADFVFRAKFKRSRGSTLEFRRGKWFKPREGSRKAREFRDLTLDNKDNCCTTKLRAGLPYIVMGVIRGDQNVATFIMPWNGNDKILKNAIRTFRSMDCSNPLPMTLGTEDGNRNSTIGAGGRRKRRKQGRRRSRQYGGCRVSASGTNQ